MTSRVSTRSKRRETTKKRKRKIIRSVPIYIQQEHHSPVDAVSPSGPVQEPNRKRLSDSSGTASSVGSRLVGADDDDDDDDDVHSIFNIIYILIHIHFCSQDPKINQCRYKYTGIQTTPSYIYSKVDTFI